MYSFTDYLKDVSLTFAPVLHTKGLTQLNCLSGVAGNKQHCCGTENFINFMCTADTNFIVPVHHCTFIAALVNTISIFVCTTNLYSWMHPPISVC